MRTCPLPFVLLLAACSRGVDTPPTVLGAATIGPAGGELVITSGKQAGLRLSVPAGAVADPVEIRVVDAEVVLPAELLATSYAPEPASAFRLEPTDLYLDLPAALRLPYDPLRLRGMAPGNVRVRQQRSGATVDLDPPMVDAVAGRVEIASRSFGRFQVVRGPLVGGLGAYQPPSDAVVALADGWSFTAAAVPAASPFAGPEARQWHLTGPGFDEVLFFDGLDLRGREAPQWWREAWDQPVVVWQDVDSVVPQATTITMQVQAPLTQLSLGGSMTVLGVKAWDVPRPLGDRLVYDVVQLKLDLAWNRHDVGVGQRQYLFWFAPEVGLLALAIDGVVHERAAP
jgi:hypothetical protein